MTVGMHIVLAAMKSIFRQSPPPEPKLGVPMDTGLRGTLDRGYVARSIDRATQINQNTTDWVRNRQKPTVTTPPSKPVTTIVTSGPTVKRGLKIG